MTVKITYVECPRENVPPEAEAVRQIFSAIVLVQDRLCEVELEHKYTPEQEAAFQEANGLLMKAHRILKKSVPLRVPKKD